MTNTPHFPLARTRREFLLHSGGGLGAIALASMLPQAAGASPSVGGGGPCAINCANTRDSLGYAWHTGGIHIALCDGSARFLSEHIDASVTCALITRANEEVLGDF